MNRSNCMKLIALACLWGRSFAFVELSLEGIGPLTLVHFADGNSGDCSVGSDPSEEVSGAG